jgi:hypothetical protein
MLAIGMQGRDGAEHSQHDALGGCRGVVAGVRVSGCAAERVCPLWELLCRRQTALRQCRDFVWSRLVLPS